MKNNIIKFITISLVVSGCSRDFVFPFDVVVINDTASCPVSDTCLIPIGLYQIDELTHDSTLWSCTYAIRQNCPQLLWCDTVNCDDGNACTEDVCYEVARECRSVFGIPIDCNDNDPCTMDLPRWDCPDTVYCQNIQTCNYTFCDTADCSDESDCTIDVCDSVLNECIMLLGGCDDADACTRDTCYLNGQCGWWDRTYYLCDEIDYCTAGVCVGDADSFHCVYTYNYRSCDDGDPCTTDSCGYYGCSNDWYDWSCWCSEHEWCNDGDECTVDGCGDSIGECVYTLIDCNDFDECTNDYCINGHCGNALINCDDRLICTVDWCGEGCQYDDTCTTCPFDTFLIDYCKFLVCVDGVTFNASRDCTDDDLCTNDICNKITAECWHLPVVCDDGTGQPFCCDDASGGCMWGFVCCEDNNACTIDNWDAQVCTHFPVNCDDGSGTPYWCDIQIGCQYGFSKNYIHEQDSVMLYNYLGQPVQYGFVSSGIYLRTGIINGNVYMQKIIIP